MPNSLLASLNPALARELAMNSLPAVMPAPASAQATPVQRLTQMPQQAIAKPQDMMGGKEKFGAPQTPHRDSGLRRFLGNLGDALLVASGGEPIYQQRVQQRELGAQLANYLGMGNPALAEILASNPEAGMALYNAMREDKRFERTAGQDDRRIGISEGQLGLGRDELDERRRSNEADEGLTRRGQDVSAATQVRLQQMRDRSAQLAQQHAEAMARQDHERAKELLALKQDFDREIALLSGDGAYEETVVETPGTEAVDGWFSDTPATPSTRTVTRRPIRSQPQQGYTQADLEFTARKHGITVAEVKRRLGVN